jgi:hypothetical protein
MVSLYSIHIIFPSQGLDLWHILIIIFPSLSWAQGRDVLWPSLSHMRANCPTCVNFFTYYGTVIITWFNNPLSNSSRSGVTWGYGSLLSNNPRRGLQIDTHLMQILPELHIFRQMHFWEAALSHKDFTQLWSAPSYQYDWFNWLQGVRSAPFTSAFSHNHVYITISISLWIDWVWYYCIEILKLHIITMDSTYFDTVTFLLHGTN